MTVSNNKRRKILVAMLLAVISSLLLVSCYRDFGLNTQDYDVVVTVFDKEANFKRPTYFMPDTVVHYGDSTLSDNIDRSKDGLILSTIAQNMSNRGYQRITVVDSTKPAPDFIILVGATITQNTGAIVYPPSWGWWPGWGWYPGWGGGWYPGGVSYYNYTTGTVLISFMDSQRIEPPNRFGVTWLAGLNGLLSSSEGSESRITSRIIQAFSQSPYIRAN